MKTITHPRDYARRFVVVNEWVKCCLGCGGRIVSLPPTGAVGCLGCWTVGGLWVWVRESDAEFLREALREEVTASD